MYFFITGATSTGKSALAAELARQINGEVISCDSMQVYKGMDIGTAKITEAEKAGVPHHMIDILPPDAEFSVAEYKAKAKDIADKIESAGKKVIFAGGTGLYINSVLFDYSFEEKQEIRKLSVPKKDAVVCVLNLERQKLYERINARVDKMFECGLRAEVERLLNSGISFDNQSMKAIGYKEFKEEESDETVKELIKKNTRNYAKRQITWFKSWGFARWFDAETEREDCLEYLIKKANNV